MMILHTLNRSAFSFDTSTVFANLAAGDLLLLIEDGVYTALHETSLTRLQALGVTPIVLGPDVAARGLGKRVPDSMRVVDYDGFVSLVCETDKTVSWF